MLLNALRGREGVTRVTFIFLPVSDKQSWPLRARLCGAVNLPEGSQRVGAQEVVEADVLVSCDVDHLERRLNVQKKNSIGVQLSVSQLVGRNPPKKKLCGEFPLFYFNFSLKGY